MIDHGKLLQGLVDITNYLYDNQFTYCEAEEFVKLLTSELSTGKECREYETYDDKLKNHKCCHLDNHVIFPLNKVNIEELFKL